MLFRLLFSLLSPAPQAAVLPELFVSGGARMVRTVETEGALSSTENRQLSYPLLSLSSRFTLKTKNSRQLWRLGLGGDVGWVTATTPFLWSARASLAPYRLLYPTQPGWFSLSPRFEIFFERFSHGVAMERRTNDMITSALVLRETSILYALLKADFEFQMGPHTLTLTPGVGHSLLSYSQKETTLTQQSPGGWRLGFETTLIQMVV